MIPRSVKMAKSVEDTIGSYYVGLYGNILAPTYRGWSNMSPEWFLGGPSTIGLPTMFQFSVRNFYESEPLWAQRPNRKFGQGYSAILYPQQDSPTPPPTSTIDSGAFGG